MAESNGEFSFKSPEERRQFIEDMARHSVGEPGQEPGSVIVPPDMQEEFQEARARFLAEQEISAGSAKE